MAKGTLTYRAEVSGPLFARFDPFEIQAAEAGVEKVVVEWHCRVQRMRFNSLYC
jgi:hypothetical protein